MQQTPFSENGPFPSHAHPSAHPHGGPGAAERVEDRTLSVSPHDGPHYGAPHHGHPRNGGWQHAAPTGGNGATSAAPGSPSQRGDHRLTDLVDRAETSISDLERLARTTLDATAAATQAASDLQERLRLGVRMLQAFDVQIERSQLTAGQVQAQINPHALQQVAMQVQASVQGHIQSHVAGLAQQAEMRIRSLTEAFERRLAEAMHMMDERLRGGYDEMMTQVASRLAATEQALEARLAGRQDELRRCVDGLAAGFASKLEAIARETRPADPAAATALAETESRLRTLCAEIETRAAGIETTVSRADERLRHLNRQSAEAADGLLATVGTASTLKDLVAEEARASKDLADETAARTRELHRELGQLLERCSTTRASLTMDLERFVDASRSIEARSATAKALQAELDALLTRLGPWESVVRRDVQPAGHVIDTISTTVRQTLADEMRGLSSALRTLATRAETTFTTGRFDEFSAMGDPVEPPAVDPGSMVAPTPITTSTRATAIPFDTHRLTAEILALENTTLLRPADTHVA